MGNIVLSLFEIKIFIEYQVDSEGAGLVLTRYPIGDFLLFENFSNSSHSSFSARDFSFNHQYLHR